MKNFLEKMFLKKKIKKRMKNLLFFLENLRNDENCNVDNAISKALTYYDYKFNMNQFSKSHKDISLLFENPRFVFSSTISHSEDCIQEVSLFVNPLFWSSEIYIEKVFDILSDLKVKDIKLLNISQTKQLQNIYNEWRFIISTLINVFEKKDLDKYNCYSHLLLDKKSLFIEIKKTCTEFVNSELFDIKYKYKSKYNKMNTFERLFLAGIFGVFLILVYLSFAKIL